VEKHYAGANSLTWLLSKIKTVFNAKADKSELTEFITSKEKDSADPVEDYFEDETNYATVGYVDSQMSQNMVDTKPASEIESEDTTFITGVSVSGTKLIITI